MDFLINKFKAINFLERYIFICNQFDDINNAFKIDTKTMKKVLKDLDFEMVYFSRDRLFEKNYSFDTFSLRFLISFKNGYIEPFYFIKLSMSDDFYTNRFDGIARNIDKNFDNRINTSFPIACSEKDLSSILKSLVGINNSFVNTF